MRILYGIQGTGNGHISRARTYLPYLDKIAEVDVLISGSSSEIKLDRPITYRVHGLGYTFGRNGGIDFIDSLKKFRPGKFWNDIRDLPVQNYDLVISDFEPVSARAAIKKGVISIGLSHQAAFLSEKTPRPKKRSIAGELIFRHYAPCDHFIGFHYKPYDDNIFPPVISDEIRCLEAQYRLRGLQNDNWELQSGNSDKNGVDSPGTSSRQHATVYLPSYDHRCLVSLLKNITRIDWHIFSKYAATPYRDGNIRVYPIDVQNYIRSLSDSDWLICGAGFETPSESIYLGKPLMAVPMKWQYEQYCNAAALEQLGVKVCKTIDKGFVGELDKWLDEAKPIQIRYGNYIEAVIDRILNLYELGSGIKTYHYLRNGSGIKERTLPH